MCGICNKKYSGIKNLQMHRNNIHIKKEENYKKLDKRNIKELNNKIIQQTDIDKNIIVEEMNKNTHTIKEKINDIKVEVKQELKEVRKEVKTAIRTAQKLIIGNRTKQV